jgi:hypothetical protein
VDEIAKLSPEDILQKAQEYLRMVNRTVYTVVPGAKVATANNN